MQKMTKDKDNNITLKLAEKIKITHDTYIFRFAFPDPDWTFGLPIGNHVIFSADIATKEHPEKELVQRKYTPTSEITNTGHIDFVIKIYRKNVAPRFPDGGVMTQYLESMNIGDTMLMEGPKGRLNYLGFGEFKISGRPINLKKKNIGCVAGGTGITPCFQVIQAALKNEDGTKLSLIFGNRTIDDILVKEELIAFETNYKDSFSLYLTVDIAPDPSANWKYGTGFVTKDMIDKNLPKPGPDTVILYCGPPPFEEMMKKHLGELGYSDDMVFKF